MNNINLKNKNSSLFTNFVKNVVHNPSTEVQKNFMDISLKIAETIRKICEEENLFLKFPTMEKNIGNKVKLSILFCGWRCI